MPGPRQRMWESRRRLAHAPEVKTQAEPQINRMDADGEWIDSVRRLPPQTGDRMSPCRQPTACRRSGVRILRCGARAFCALSAGGHSVRRLPLRTGDRMSPCRQPTACRRSGVRFQRSGARAFCALSAGGHPVRRFPLRTGDRMSPCRQPTACRRSGVCILRCGARAFCALSAGGHSVRSLLIRKTGTAEGGCGPDARATMPHPLR